MQRPKTAIELREGAIVGFITLSLISIERQAKHHQVEIGEPAPREIADAELINYGAK